MMSYEGLKLAFYEDLFLTEPFVNSRPKATLVR